MLQFFVDGTRLFFLTGQNSKETVVIFMSKLSKLSLYCTIYFHIRCMCDQQYLCI